MSLGIVKNTVTNTRRGPYIKKSNNTVSFFIFRKIKISGIKLKFLLSIFRIREN